MGINSNNSKSMGALEYRNKLRTKNGLPPLEQSIKPKKPPSLHQRVGKLVEDGLLEKDVLIQLESSDSLTASERDRLIKETRAACKKAEMKDKLEGWATDLLERINFLVGGGFVEIEPHGALLVSLQEAVNASDRSKAMECMKPLVQVAREAEQVRRAELETHRSNARLRSAWSHRLKTGRVSPYALLVNNPKTYKSAQEFMVALREYYGRSQRRFFDKIKGSSYASVDRYGITVFDSIDHLYAVISTMKVEDLQRLLDAAISIADTAREVIDEDSVESLGERRLAIEDALVDHEVLSGKTFKREGRLVVQMFALSDICGNRMNVGF